MSAKKKPSQKQEILNLLRERQERGATSWEIANELRILNHTARMTDLREDGHEINCTRMADGTQRFVLTHDADNAEPVSLFESAPAPAEPRKPLSAIGGLDAA